MERSDTTREPATRQRPALQPWCILPQPPRFVFGLEWEWVAVVERSDTTGEPLKGHRPMFLVHSAPATRPIGPRPWSLVHSAPATRPMAISRNACLSSISRNSPKQLGGLFRFLVRASRDLWAFLLGEGRFPRHSHLSPEDPLGEEVPSRLQEIHHGPRAPAGSHPPPSRFLPRSFTKGT